MNDAGSLRPHPAAGHLAVERTPFTDVITEPVTDRQVARARVRLDRNRRPEVPEFIREMFGDDVHIIGAATRHEYSDDDIREVLAEGMCSFEAGIVVEVGMMPGGLELDYANEGCKVYFHENRGHTIGDLTFLSIDQIIAWE